MSASNVYSHHPNFFYEVSCHGQHHTNGAFVSIGNILHANWFAWIKVFWVKTLLPRNAVTVISYAKWSRLLHSIGLKSNISQ